jgi:NitT/TauT family transport system permease protein
MSNTSGRVRLTMPSKLKKPLMVIISFLVVLLVWEIASRLYGLAFIFPGPLLVAETFIQTTLDGSLLNATTASLSRILTGFAIGSLVGVLLGLLFGSSKIFVGLTMPFVTFFRFIPPLAWFAPALVWFGAGEVSKIVLVMYTSVFVVALNTLEASRSIPEDLQRMASTAGISWSQRMFWVTLPASVPYIVAGSRIAMGNAFMTVVSAEMLGASDGLGVMINNGMISTNIPPVFCAIIVLGVLGFAADRLFVKLFNTVGRKYQTGGSQNLA